MNNLILNKFLHNGKPVEDGPVWGMTRMIHGSMRFRWNEINENRNSFLAHFCGTEKNPAAVELIHSKIIYDIDSADEVFQKQGDGIITRDRKIVPVVTVADCVPLFIYDVHSGSFGALHSGWKGTGIVGEAIEILKNKYGSTNEDICVSIGPHIGACCYDIDSNRADYFTRNFGPSCVKRIDDNSFSLSLTEANLEVLRKAGIPCGNIMIHDPCTCCHKENEEFKFGSFRRQTMGLPEDMPLEEKLRKFTVQAAFTCWK